MLFRSFCNKIYIDHVAINKDSISIRNEVLFIYTLIALTGFAAAAFLTTMLIINISQGNEIVAILTGIALFAVCCYFNIIKVLPQVATIDFAKQEVKISWLQGIFKRKIDFRNTTVKATTKRQTGGRLDLLLKIGNKTIILRAYESANSPENIAEQLADQINKKLN